MLLGFTTPNHHCRFLPDMERKRKITIPPVPAATPGAWISNLVWIFGPFASPNSSLLDRFLCFLPSLRRRFPDFTTKAGVMFYLALAYMRSGLRPSSCGYILGRILFCNGIVKTWVLFNREWRSFFSPSDTISVIQRERLSGLETVIVKVKNHTTNASGKRRKTDSLFCLKRDVLLWRENIIHISIESCDEIKLFEPYLSLLISFKVWNSLKKI